MEQESFQIDYKKLNTEDLTQAQYQLTESAKKAIQSAYAPYSNFKVGAAVLLDNGEIVTGSNQENVAYPSGLCAERVALFSAHHQYPKANVKALAIAAMDKNGLLSTPIMPCGACIQVMSESIKRGGETFEVLLVSSNHILHIPTALDLIPFRFDMDF